MQVRKQIRVGCTTLSGGEATPQVTIMAHTAAQQRKQWLDKHQREWDEAPEDFEPDDDGINYSGLDPAFPDWGSVNSMFV